MKEFWQGLMGRARPSLVIGVVLILTGAGALGVWAMRTEYDVLFSNLAAPDAAAMTAELDRMKQPYKLGPDGSSIFVDRAAVHHVRLKLMGKDLPLHGAVGFELFNNADFGMTEFAQKVNYQRALQGELTRTILSIDEVESVRVHLAIPDEGLFKNPQNRPKASITLGLRNARVLHREQVTGIQRLVAAAVPSISVQDVTLVSKQGVALTRTEASEGLLADVAGLDQKRELERLLIRKATEVLEKAYGAGNVLASVDVVLNTRQSRVTKEEVIGADNGGTGVVIRERESFTDTAGGSSREPEGVQGGPSLREVEYQAGRRVEQSVSQPGAISRLQVVAVLNMPVDPKREAEAQALLAASVGASKERGDVVVVQAIQSIGGIQSQTSTDVPPGVMEGVSGASAAAGFQHAKVAQQTNRSEVYPWLAGLALLVSGLVLSVLLIRARSDQRANLQHAAAMNPAERTAALEQIRHWLADNVDEPRSRPAA